MTSPTLRRGIVLAGLAVLALVGCARGGKMTGATVGSGDPIADRQALMKLQGASMSDLNAKIRAGNIEAVAVNADTLALTAQHIARLFPQGSLSDKSRAKPEIWQRWDEFQGFAGKLRTGAEELKAAAVRKDAAAAQAAAANVGRQACGPCHDAFRKPAS